MNTKKQQEGFTIIEVMIVLAIAGLIIVVALIAIPQLQRNQRNNARQAVMSRISTEVGSFAGNNNGAIPLQDDMQGFVERYLDGINIEDPRTGDPMFTVDSFTASPEVDEGNIPTITEAEDLGTASYAPGYRCEGEQVLEGSGRDFALYTVQEGGSIYCVDNS